MEEIKLSFRGGGERPFYERLKGSLTQRKWLLQTAPSVPTGSRAGEGGAGRERVKTAGIAGIEQLGLNMRRNNEILIGNAFEDLETLMASAKEVVALAERLARQTASANGGASSETNALVAHSASELGLVTTKDLVGTGGSSEMLYLSELSRHMAEFLTDDTRPVLKRAGGILTLVDLWAMFNRARGGVELVSPTDFEKAARMWETLKLPLRLRKFKKSGVLVVQGRDRTDEMTIKALDGWMNELHSAEGTGWEARTTRKFGRGVTARDVAERFGWSVGVAEEELEMATERGVLCREESIEGLKFWQNFLVDRDLDCKGDLEKWVKEKEKSRQDRAIMSNLKKNGLL
jgi:ESCRT-II complex subunit VPS36